jgi:hypothetical protein
MEVLQFSTQASNFIKNSTCSHGVVLKKDETLYLGVYNGLTSSGIVEDGEGKMVEYLGTETEDDGYQPLFNLSDFQSSGYEIVSEEELLNSEIVTEFN